MKKLTDKLRHSVGTLWDKEFNHPFVQGIGSGTLSQENFQYFMKQDYLFLVEFSRCIAIAIGKSKSVQEMEWLSHLLNETLKTEMHLHIDYCAEIGIPPKDLVETEMSPSTAGYTNHLLETAYSQTSLAAEVAILPCCWSYAEIGQRLSKIQTSNNEPHFSKWITLYSADEFWNLSMELRNLIDHQGATVNETEQKNLMDIFLKSTHYEYRFWEAAYSLEKW